METTKKVLLLLFVPLFTFVALIVGGSILAVFYLAIGAWAHAFILLNKAPLWIRIGCYLPLVVGLYIISPLTIVIVALGSILSLISYFIVAGFFGCLLIYRFKFAKKNSLS